jgi:hypothetical protein
MIEDWLLVGNWTGKCGPAGASGKVPRRRSGGTGSMAAIP